ncbi:MAG: hypothetical protein PHU51_02230 [Candidatus Nanoarchaeia archaeon]|nr:hypothetical protein [Candidatus Nanoarchaeia archaeon]
MGFINRLFGKKNTGNIQTELNNSKKGYVLHDLNIVARQIELTCNRISEFKEPLIHELNEERKAYNVINENNKDRLENLKTMELISKQIAKLRRDLEVKGETHSEEYVLYYELNLAVSDLIEKKNLMHIYMHNQGEEIALNLLKNNNAFSELNKVSNYLKQLKHIIERSFKKGDFEKDFESTEKSIIETINIFCKEIEDYKERIKLNIDTVIEFMNSGKGQYENQYNVIKKIKYKHNLLITKIKDKLLIKNMDDKLLIAKINDKLHIMNIGNETILDVLDVALKKDFMSDVKKNMWVQIDQSAKKNYEDKQFKELNRMFASINGIKIAYMNFLKYRYEEYDKNLRAKNRGLANFLRYKFQN